MVIIFTRGLPHTVIIITPSPHTAVAGPVAAPPDSKLLPPLLLPQTQGLVSAATYVLQSTREALVATAKQFPDWPVLITGAHAQSGPG